MNRPLAFAALVEAVTGLSLMVAPSFVGQLLLGAELSGVASVIGRVTGIALLALGVACWPGGTALRGMLAYSTLATAYLTWLGIGGEWVGPFLWPAVVAHLVITVLLARAFTSDKKAP